jgi:hypothetical protein
MPFFSFFAWSMHDPAYDRTPALHYHTRHARILLLPAVQSCRRTRVILSLCSGVMSPTADADRASADRGARPSRRRPPPAPTTGQVAVPSRRPLRGQNARPASQLVLRGGGAPHHPSTLARSRPHALPLAGRRSFCIGTARARRARHHWVRGRRGGLGAPTPARTPPGTSTSTRHPAARRNWSGGRTAGRKRNATTTGRHHIQVGTGIGIWETRKNERSDQALHTGRAGVQAGGPTGCSSCPVAPTCRQAGRRGLPRSRAPPRVPSGALPAWLGTGTGLVSA